MTGGVGKEGKIALHGTISRRLFMEFKALAGGRDAQMCTKVNSQ